MKIMNPEASGETRNAEREIMMLNFLFLEVLLQKGAKQATV